MELQSHHFLSFSFFSFGFELFGALIIFFLAEFGGRKHSCCMYIASSLVTQAAPNRDFERLRTAFEFKLFNRYTPQPKTYQ